MLDPDKFYETYMPLSNKSTRTTIWEASDVGQMPDNKVWTIVESKNADGLDVIAGFKENNSAEYGVAIGYIITAESWETDDERHQWVRWGTGV